MSNSASSVWSPFFIGLIAIVLVGSPVAQDAPPMPANSVPQGAILLIQLSDRLDTHTAKAGDGFQARLAEAVTAANGQTIDAGKKIKGHISAVEPGLRRRLLLSFDEIETSHGWVPLIATVTGVPGNKRIRRGSFDSVRSLEKAIEEYLLYNNQYPKPFVWTADADLILGKIQRLCERISNSQKPTPAPQTSSTNV